ncbi:MAG: ring-cleaving dioxygenase [Fimbriimonadales bacterium]|nr:ring-cleaving dioxygenase [Fimbriimonadales bacterium]
MAAIGVLGFHHATAFAGDAQRNVDFYAGVLGLRMVKRSVNQDAPDIYHLFYADAVGSPGTDITFFPWRNIAPMHEGAGIITETALSVPVESLSYWSERLQAAGIAVEPVAEAYGAPALRFRDPEGLRLALLGIDDARPFVAWERSPVPAEHQIRGLVGAQLTLHALGATERVLTEILGFTPAGTDGAASLYRVGQPNALGYGYLKVVATPDAPRGRWGKGCMHHLAWRVRDEQHLSQLREQVASVGLQPTPIIDRFWFKSVYFREPGGVIFELATDGPGFGVDEPSESLGERLVLPPWLEPRRAELEAKLPPITYPPHLKR